MRIMMMMKKVPSFGEENSVELANLIQTINPHHIRAFIESRRFEGC